LGGEELQRSQNFSVSKSKVKFAFSTVRTRVIPILKGIEAKIYPAKIGRVRGWSKQHVAYYVKKMEKVGLIRRLKQSNFVDYELTQRGQNFLISCEGVLFSSGFFGYTGVFSSFLCCVRGFIRWVILGGWRCRIGQLFWV
jgi:predicted transcriptional regulator